MKTNEYKEFEALARKVISVPHTDIARKLKEEKVEKRRKKSKKSSASRVGA